MIFFYILLLSFCHPFEGKKFRRIPKRIYKLFVDRRDRGGKNLPKLRQTIYGECKQGCPKFYMHLWKLHPIDVIEKRLKIRNRFNINFVDTVFFNPERNYYPSKHTHFDIPRLLSVCYSFTITSFCSPAVLGFHLSADIQLKIIQLNPYWRRHIFSHDGICTFSIYCRKIMRI